MQVIPAVGATCLGIVIGWLVRYFIRRFEGFNAQILGSVVSILLGGAVVRFLDADKTVWWFYPIGLLLGFIVYSIVAALVGGKDAAGALFRARQNTGQSDKPKSDQGAT